jgi:3',5'-cyclic AMP phosphodiesterase CpdA
MARIIQLSDVHFGGEHPAALAGAADYIHANPFDLLLITGDVTAIGSRPEFAKAKAWFETLPGPQLFMPGNHDTPWAGMISRLLWPFGRYKAHFGEPEQGAYARGALNVQSLNTARGIQPRSNWSKGQIAPRQVRRAIEGFSEATAAPGAARILACHHPLVEMVGGPMTGKVWGGPRAAEAFAEAGVDMILTGHLHVPFALALPYGDHRTYAIGCGTLSLRERGFPPSFNVIEIEPGCIRVTAQGWKGSHYEPERTWALDRR